MENRSGNGRGLWIGLGLGLAAGLIGARATSSDGPTVVGISTLAQDHGGPRVYRVWSNGVIEYGRWNGDPRQPRLERWETVSSPAVYPGP